MCCAMSQDERLDQGGLRWMLSRQSIFFRGSPFLFGTEHPAELRSERLRSRLRVQEASNSAPLQLAMGTMLVVIPNLPSGKGLSGILRQAGYKPLLARWPAETECSPFATHDAVVIVLGGLAQTEYVYCVAKCAAPQVPILVVGPDEPEVKISLLERGIEDYLTMPFDPMELLARIIGMIRRYSVPAGRSS
jgi:PleD family two-component response regulator